jgi:hypothetical protein
VLLVTDEAAEKLGARGISAAEAQQIVDNRRTILENTGRDRRNVRELHARRLLVGPTNGGRMLTLVVERTVDPTTWLLVTGWDSSRTERRMRDS